MQRPGSRTIVETIVAEEFLGSRGLVRAPINHKKATISLWCNPTSGRRQPLLGNAAL